MPPTTAYPPQPSEANASSPQQVDLQSPDGGKYRAAFAEADQLMQSANQGPEPQANVPAQPLMPTGQAVDNAVDPLALPEKVGGEVQVPAALIPTPEQPVPVRAAPSTFTPNPAPIPQADLMQPPAPPQPPRTASAGGPPSFPPMPPNENPVPSPYKEPARLDGGAVMPAADTHAAKNEAAFGTPLDQQPDDDIFRPAGSDTPLTEAPGVEVKADTQEKSTPDLGKLSYQEVNRIAQESPSDVLDYVASRVEQAKTPQEIHLAMLETKPLMDLVYYYHLQK